MKLLVGVEGGGTHSRHVILDASNGAILAQNYVPVTYNLFQVGPDKACELVADNLKRFAAESGFADTTFDAVGLAISGAGHLPEIDAKIVCGLKASNPTFAKEYTICNDTIGSLATAIAPGQGGVVLIAGTGSNCQIALPNGNYIRSGGYGHMLGDEGGGYWIVHLAIKNYMGHRDNMYPSPFDVCTIENIIEKHFEINVIEHLDNILIPFYREFDKKRVASMCEKLSHAAASGDQFCQQIFREAGAALAKHVVAVERHATEEMLSKPLPILCVGSVWNSWSLLEAGFVDWMSKHSAIKNYVLEKPKVSAAAGAAVHAAHKIGVKVNVDYRSWLERIFSTQ